MTQKSNLKLGLDFLGFVKKKSLKLISSLNRALITHGLESIVGLSDIVSFFFLDPFTIFSFYPSVCLMNETREGSV